MATTRSNKPTNLKERIAALEQRSTSNTTSPPTSPTTSTPPTAYNAQSVGTLKDKIARFERKGRVPVPRGSFGLGAPPTAEGPKRQGELYGNRIQALTPQYTGGSLASISSLANSSQRRSVSASVLSGNFDDNYLDSTPISSPTPTSPVDSPTISPETSPSRSITGDIPVVRRNATRGTSFHEALEFARKVEAAKKEALLLPAKKKSTDADDTNENAIENSTPVLVSKDEADEAEMLFGPTPAILVSSDDPDSARPVVDEPSAQPSGMTDPVVLPSGAATVRTPVLDGSEMERDLILADSTTANPVVIKAESVKPPNNDNGTSTRTTQLSTPSPPTAKPALRALPVPPRPETPARGKGESGSNTKSDMDQPEPIPLQTPQIVLNGAQAVPVVVEITEVKLNAAKSELPDEYKGLDTEVLVTAVAASKDVDTPTASKSAIPSETSAPATANVDELPPRPRSHIPVPRTRPTIQPPEPSSMLSPPPSGFRSAQFSPGLSAGSSGSSRPLSMMEMSPSEVSRALKMTPATGRGIPVFVPPANLQTRKTDFIFLPPSPGDNPNTETGRDAGIGFHKTGSEPDLTFKAVVHGKVKETPASATLPTKRLALPETPIKDLKRATILQSPLSPGHGELAALLQEAMLLEDTLNKGELPGESPADDVSMDPKSNVLGAAKLKEEERQRLAHASAQLRSKRDMPTHGRLKHTFLMPLSKARAAQKQEPLVITEQASPRSSREDSRLKGTPSDLAAKEVVHEKFSSTGTQSSPSKIPKLSKFPSFKRFGSISRTVTQQEALLRHTNSMSSEISSEDSNLIVTPPDNTPLEFGERRSTTKDADQQSSHSQALSFSFPSLSPKKSASIGRAASFAEKMWSRARTKSNGSVLSSNGMTHRSTEELMPQLPVLSELPPIPSLGSIVPPLTDKEPAQHYPASGSSLRIRADMSGPSTALPSKASTNQPFSPMSMSSIGSLPSPLFDKDICDAFPSVPTGTPAQLSSFYLARGSGFSAAAATPASADFDSALLSSAIHLAARNKGSTPVPPTR